MRRSGMPASASARARSGSPVAAEQLPVAVGHDPARQQADHPDAARAVARRRCPWRPRPGRAAARWRCRDRAPGRAPRWTAPARSRRPRAAAVRRPCRAARMVPRKTVSKDEPPLLVGAAAAVPGGGPPTEISAPSSRPKCSRAAATSRSGVSGSARSAVSPTACSGPPSCCAAAATASAVAGRERPPARRRRPGTRRWRSPARGRRRSGRTRGRSVRDP